MTGPAGAEPAAWLAVIDMQRVFAEPDSPWLAPRFAEVVEPIRRLVAVFGPRVTFTRFVAPDVPQGAWQGYYAQWPSALQPRDAPIYDLVNDSGKVVLVSSFVPLAAGLFWKSATRHGAQRSAACRSNRRERAGSSRVRRWPAVPAGRAAA